MCLCVLISKKKSNEENQMFLCLFHLESVGYLLDTILQVDVCAQRPRGGRSEYVGVYWSRETIDHPRQ